MQDTTDMSDTLTFGSSEWRPLTKMSRPVPFSRPQVRIDEVEKNMVEAEVGSRTENWQPRSTPETRTLLCDASSFLTFATATQSRYAEYAVTFPFRVAPTCSSRGPV